MVLSTIGFCSIIRYGVVLLKVKTKLIKTNLQRQSKTHFLIFRPKDMLNLSQTIYAYQLYAYKKRQQVLENLY